MTAPVQVVAGSWSLQIVVEACCPTLAVTAAGTATVTVPGVLWDLAACCPRKVRSGPMTQMRRRTVPGRMPVVGIAGLRTVGCNQVDKLPGVVVRILSGSGAGLEAGGCVLESLSPAVDTDDAVNVLKPAAANMVKCGVSEEHARVFVAGVGRPDGCKDNLSQGVAAAGMWSVMVSFGRGRVVVGLSEVDAWGQRRERTRGRGTWGHMCLRQTVT